MGLMRPPRKGVGMMQQPAPSLEISLEQQILTEIQGLREEVGGTRSQIRDMRTMLFGIGEEGVPETAQGRLARQDARIAAVEAKGDAQEKEIGEIKGRINSVQSGATAYWSVARVAWAFGVACFVAVLGGGAEALIGWLVLHK
jgi:hypothetical protein